MRILLAGASLFLLGALGHAAGLRVNHSASMPRGLWLETVKGSIARGDIVIACLPPDEVQKRYLDVGPCHTGLEPVLKPVAAVAGDQVAASEDGVSVNGHLLPDSAPLPRDRAGRLLPHKFGSTSVPPGYVWLIVQMPESFDSRYYGPVPIDQIEAVATPLLVWR